MSRFLVIYDRNTGASKVREFAGDDAAARILDARIDAEALAGPDVEVATLTASSERELRLTHARYFQSPQDMLDDFGRILAS